MSNEYQMNNALDASKALMSAHKLLKDADHNLFDMFGMSYQHKVYMQLQQALIDLHQEYYQKYSEISDLLDKQAKARGE